MNILNKTSYNNITYSPNRTISYIAIHYTAGTTSRTGSATNTALWFANPSAGGTADFIVDDTTAVQFNPDPYNYYCWAVGDGSAGAYGNKVSNRNSISIEICSTNSTGGMTYPNDAYYYFTDAVVNVAVELTKYLMQKYNIPASNVIRHYDVSLKQCPGVRGWGTDGGDASKWNAFKTAISGYNVGGQTTSKYTKIMGTSVATAKQMETYLKSVNPKVAQSVIDMIPLYLSEGKIEGVRGDIAFAQSCLETGNFGFGGGTAVTLDQNNFCGMGVTSKGLKGNSFDTPQLGIRAQIQHLKAYGSTEALKQECIDPRFKYVTRKSAEYWEWLGIPDNPNGYGWAGGECYGEKILAIYNKIVGTKTTTSSSSTTTVTALYRIRKSWADAKSQIGAFFNLDNAIAQWKSGYFIYDENGKQVYPKAKKVATLTGAQSLNMPEVKKGSTGVAVNMLQCLLGTSVTGTFGDKDVTSLKTFQKNVGLTQDGECGKQTWAKIVVHMQANTYGG